MNKTSFHKYTRVLYYGLSLFILFLSIYKLWNNTSTFYSEEYIFLSSLAVSFILLNKYSIKLKDTTLNFNDFILIVCYIKFNIYITVLLIFICYITAFLIEYKHSKNMNLLTENIFIYNSSLVILSTFIAHLVLDSLNKIYYIMTYETTALVIFSIIILLVNYVLFCSEISIKRTELTLITLDTGLYYILLNFSICTVIACLSLYLYKLYGYMPIVAMTALIIFISFTLNSLNKLRTSNENLKAISQCSTRIMTNGDFKVSLQNSIQTVERILPFIYCGIYLVRDNYDSLYPVCYKCNTLISLEDLKFLSIKDNSIYREIINGNTIYTESKYFTGIIPIINTLSKEIKYTAVIPIRTADFTTGFMLICFDRHLDINEELELLSTLGAHIGMINFYINTNIKDNIIGYKNYDGLTRYIDYNIKHKIFFTLAVIEIENYMDIIEKYNLDFYEAYKLELARIISKLLSSNDIMLCFEKEDIYVIFNLLDSKNAQSKLQQIASFLESYKFNDILLNTKISYAASEYPMDGVNGDEILANTYRKLHSNKNA